MSKLNMTRRQALKAALFGPGCIGLKSLATGLPISVLLNGIPRNAQAIDGSPQYLILMSWSDGHISTFVFVLSSLYRKSREVSLTKVLIKDITLCSSLDR